MTTALNMKKSETQVLAGKGNVFDLRDFQDTATVMTSPAERRSFKKMFAALKSKAERILRNNDAVRNLVTSVLTFTKKLGNVSFLKKWFVDVPLVCDMLIDTVNGEYKNIPYSSMLTVTAAIIYILSPMDFITDTLPILGIADDAMIFKIVLNTIKNDVETYRAWKETREAA